MPQLQAAESTDDQIMMLVEIVFTCFDDGTKLIHSNTKFASCYLDCWWHLGESKIVAILSQWTKYWYSSFTRISSKSNWFLENKKLSNSSYWSSWSQRRHSNHLQKSPSSTTNNTSYSPITWSHCRKTADIGFV